MIALFDLVDIWRQIYPDKKGYTWRRFNSFQQSRLDYFLISDSLLTDVKGVKVLSGYRSDHSMIFLELESNRKKKDRQFWKFNNALLKDKEYMQIIKKVIKDVKNQYAALVYDFDNLDTIPEEYIQFRINDQLFFETLLMEIRGKTISYATFKKKEENKLEKQLIDDINQLEARLPNFSVEDLEEKKAQLEELRTRKLEGMIIRSRARWLQDGEKTSRYFCNLEKRNYLDKSMHFLEVDNGELTFDNDEIVKETKLFYEHLYAAKDVVDIDLNDIISDAPTLDEDEKELLEGPILYEEAVSALKAMKNNKSPGSDGFTCEFFKFFFCDIGTFLVRSLNFGFQAGYMSITQRFGTITLIPKESKPKHFLKNWRPISLLNTAYKIASSCIAARIKAVLYKLIHKNQTGFLKGRYIGENIRLLYDILLFTEEENIPGQILTVDFEKAFDSVSWVFIQKVLDFLNFGQDLKNWIKAFYNDISACVAVNGRYTSAFKICRGVRQGDPLSPYLYLLCAEILSLLIRKNDRIRGLTIQGTEHLLSQFADDTTVYLDGSEISFNETIRLLERFACMSGLKINHEKTNVIWIGCMKNSRKRYMRDKNFCWDPGIFTVLGIKFTTAIDQIVNINYEGKLKLIKNILVKWKKRHLTPFGKITVIKTLALSKLIYLFSNLPDPNYNFLQELDTLFFKFLWDEKQTKISKKCVCNDCESGGLKMLNVHSFLSAVKVCWLKRIFSKEEHNLKEIAFFFVPGLDCIFGGEYANKLLLNSSNMFWFDVLKHYKKLCSKCKPSDVHEFLAENIHYNANITIDKKTIFVKKMVDEGICQIRDLLNEGGNFLSYEHFCTKYPNIRINYLVFIGIIQAIKKYQKKCGVRLVSKYKLLNPTVWTTIMKGNKCIYSTLANSDARPAGLKKWNAFYENLNWRNIFKKLLLTTSDTQLRWFQFRLLYRIIPTGRYLFLRKAIDSPLCLFCNEEEETIIHLFWSCRITRAFWNDLEKILNEKCITCVNLTFSEKYILIGDSENISVDTTLDLIVLLAKMYIYKCKWNNRKPCLTAYNRLLKQRYTVELYYNTIAGKKMLIENRWFPYKFLFQ